MCMGWGVGGPGLGRGTCMGWVREVGYGAGGVRSWPLGREGGPWAAKGNATG